MAAAFNNSEERQHSKEQHLHLESPCCDKEAEALEGMLQIWSRVENREHTTDLEALLKRWPKVPGLPSHASVINVAGNAQLVNLKLKEVSEKVLNSFHVRMMGSIVENI